MEESDDDAAQEPWEAGLRQRRRRRRGHSQSSSRNVDGDGDGHDFLRREMSDNDRQTRPNDIGRNSVSIPRINRNTSATDGAYNSGIIGGAAVVGGGPPCNGNGAAAVGVQSGPTAAGGGGGLIGNAFGLGAGQFTTPYKAPMKNIDDGAGLLVAATPSSVTTAGETAESTLLSQSPINIRHRHNSNRQERSSTNATQSLHRQYQLLRSQVILLFGSSVLGLVLFLFYALPLIAFISLLLMVSSMGALLPVVISFARARYEMEMEHPLGLIRYLPDSLRVFLTETTLHEFMADTTFFMETRYLLMYFIPGLSPEQLMEYIHRLPPRHRDALLEPGLGRLVPSVMEHLMRIDDNHNNNNLRGHYDLDNPDTLMVENYGDDASSASGLTIEREHQGGDGSDVGVTFFEAVTGLRRTLSSFAFRYATDTNFEMPRRQAETSSYVDAASQRPLPQIANRATLNEAVHEGNQDGDDSSFDFSVDLSAHGLTHMVASQSTTVAPIAPAVPAAPTNISGLTNVTVELPSQNQDAMRLLQEYDLEGMILSEAASAAVANYAGQASAAARVAASDAIVSSSSWIIRAGLFTGLIAGGGGIVATFLSHRQVPFDSPGASGSTRPSNLSRPSLDGVDGSNSSGNDLRSEHRSGYVMTLYGLFATSALGFAGAGVAYLVRNRARAVIAEKRQVKRLDDAPEKES